MSENRTEQLVEDALQALHRPYGENVTDEVFEVIENDPELKATYDDIASGFGDGQAGLNRNIGHFVKKDTGRMVLAKGIPCKRNSLAKTYSKLVENSGS